MYKCKHIFDGKAKAPQGIKKENSLHEEKMNTSFSSLLKNAYLADDLKNTSYPDGVVTSETAAHLTSMRYLIVLIFSLFTLVATAKTDYPCTGISTTTLNVRSGPGTSYRRIDQLYPNEKVTVKEKSYGQWVKIQNGSQTGYVNSRYLKLEPLPKEKPHSTGKRESKFSFFNILSTLFSILLWGFSIYIIFAILYAIFKLFIGTSIIFITLANLAFRLVCLPFFLMNTLQRYLAKPWLCLFKFNRFSNNTNEVLRTILDILKFPLYLLLTPLRIANAIFFNLILHLAFEMFNYIAEVISPSVYKEGSDGIVNWVVKLPWRILKYPMYHGTITIIESFIWTGIDIILPALTLFHGTSPQAATCITGTSDRGCWRGYNTSLWIVGTGNYAGNGIYFAPARSTAEHYSGNGSLIVCRVTLGHTLDLGLAPYEVYKQCGFPNAIGATRYGLNNGYVTGEWWRSDAEWWEYCMYDWQNRYNDSWRIRPLYVIDLSNNSVQRIPCGMAHWLFRKIVIKDMWTSLVKWFDDLDL